MDEKDKAYERLHYEEDDFEALRKEKMMDAVRDVGVLHDTQGYIFKDSPSERRMNALELEEDMTEDAAKKGFGLKEVHDADYTKIEAEEIEVDAFPPLPYPEDMTEEEIDAVCHEGAFIVKDSGKRQHFETGAQRDTDEGKPRPSLIHPHFLSRLGLHMAKGAAKYDDWNWTKGIPTSRSLDSLLRHVLSIMEGEEDEDHLAAIAANTMFIMVTKELINRGILPESLDDIKTWKGGEE